MQGPLGYRGRAQYHTGFFETQPNRSLTAALLSLLALKRLSQKGTQANAATFLALKIQALIELN
jgi:hypothetical protein